MIDIFNKNILNITKYWNKSNDINIGSTIFHKNAFTLAEVLITLGIIGVVAAMTLPALIQNYQKQAFVTRGKWFYSFMSQALQRSVVDNGPMSDWKTDISVSGIHASEQYFNTYIKNYIKYTDVKSCPSGLGANVGNLCIYLANGSVFWIRPVNQGGAVDIDFFANYRKGYTSDNFLAFMIRDGKFSTYSQAWDGTRESLLNNDTFGCKEGTLKAFCAKLIEFDGWQISDDYPWRVKANYDFYD